MSLTQARKELVNYESTNPYEHLYFDYLYGRVMKIHLAGDELDTWGYNRDNGDGAAERIISQLKPVNQMP